jgi:menaquinone-dependent protoporphyrinogen oxidase
MSSTTKMSRRRFLWTAGGVMAASMLACGGSLALVATPIPALDYGHTNCGKDQEMSKVLVAYASRYGSTAEVAQAIGQELCSRGQAADVRNVEDVADLSVYDAVIIGSAIRMGRWLPAASRFVEEQQAKLRSMPTAFFTVHMLATDDSVESQQQRAAYTASERGLVPPALEAFFAGKIDPKQLNFVERMMFKATGSPGGDLRNWQAIRSWAGAVAVQEAAAEKAGVSL